MTSNSNQTPAGPLTADFHVQEVVRSAERELVALLQQRAEVMKRIGSVKQILVGIAHVFGDSVLNDELLTLLDRKASRPSGFTRACRCVLMESPAPLSARDVCHQLRKKFPGLLERHKEPVASVTTVLSRLVAYDEAHSFLNVDGRRVWRWIAGERVASTDALLANLVLPQPTTGEGKPDLN